MAYCYILKIANIFSLGGHLEGHLGGLLYNRNVILRGTFRGTFLKH